MVRALLDANVLISAAIRPSGAPGQIVRLFLAQTFEVVLSPAIIGEVETALALPKIRKYLQAPSEAPRWLSDIVILADVVRDTGAVTGVCRDPDDDVVLAAALEGRARWIVTGDDDLLTLGEYRSSDIVTPREFLGLLKSKR